MSGREERAEATRAALLRAARELFAERGYGAVGTEQIVARAGVTRGALYHHFRDKQDLFRAVFEQTEAELVESIGARVDGVADPMELLHTGVRAFLDACGDPVMMRIGLRDAPGVLGWEEWREIGARYGLGLIEALLAAGIESGEIRPQPLRPLSHALLGALDEVAMLVARSPDPAAMRLEAGETLTYLVDSLRA
jgi:AcrR family transcriptional regulator